MSDPRPAHDAPSPVQALLEVACMAERLEYAKLAMSTAEAMTYLTLSPNLNAQLGFVRDAARQYGQAQASGIAADVIGTHAYLKTALERALEALGGTHA